jgi:hypothetical protein
MTKSKQCRVSTNQDQRLLITPRSSKPPFPDSADVIENQISSTGTESLEGVLAQCEVLAHLNCY